MDKKNSDSSNVDAPENHRPDSKEGVEQITPSMMLNSQISFVIGEAREMLEQTGNVEPCFFLCVPQGLALVPADFNSFGKEALTAAVKQIAKQAEATGVIFVSSSYILRDGIESKEQVRAEMQKYGSVSNHPNSVEVVMLQAEYINSTNPKFPHIEVLFGTADLVKEGDITTFSQMKWNTEAKMSGMFSGFLAPNLKSNKEDMN